VGLGSAKGPEDSWSPLYPRAHAGSWVERFRVGALLRVAAGDGAPVSFLLVTASVLLVFLLGWRLIASVVVRVRR
jgi:hypothetical protein